MTHLFVVPGDYNLPLLDGLAQVPGLTMVNTSNELNAGYAAGEGGGKHDKGITYENRGGGSSSTC